MALLTSVSLMLIFLIPLVMVGTVWIVVKIVMVPIVNVASRITICVRMVTVLIAVVIQLVHVRCSATVKASVSANLE